MAKAMILMRKACQTDCGPHLRVSGSTGLSRPENVCVSQILLLPVGATLRVSSLDLSLCLNLYETEML